MKSGRSGDKWLLYTVAIAVLLIGFTIGLFVNRGPETNRPKNSAPAVFSLATMSLAKRFNCSCGACGERNLAVCECPTATSTKRFIESNLNSGLEEKEVINLIKELYGHYTG
jgi:cytochrome c-type biogenesis protein CcmH/NrfF